MLNPAPTSAATSPAAKTVPGPPRGPIPLSTSTSPGWICDAFTALRADNSSENTFAAPTNFRLGSLTAATFKIAPDGASVPLRTRNPPVFESGLSDLEITSLFFEPELMSCSPSVMPETVLTFKSRCSRSSESTACAPPAASNSGTVANPLGLIRASSGVFAPISSSAPITSISKPASTEMAAMCRTTLTLVAAAVASVKAFLMAPSVIISRGFVPFASRSRIAYADSVALAFIFSLPARTGAEPGRVMPRASATICMLLAVPRPAQTPGPTIATRAISANSSVLNFPTVTAPTSSYTVSISTISPRKHPAT